MNMMSTTRRVRRVQLYIPGDDLHKIGKVMELDLDSLILDLEDGVAMSQKAAARQTIVEALNNVDFGRAEKLVRINPVGSGLEADDLYTVLPCQPDGIVIPKVERPEHVTWVSEIIGELESERGWQVGAIRLLILIETARGLINLKEIASADPRLDALIFGAYDMASSLGATASKDGWEMLYHRSAIVAHAAANNLQAIDSVYIDLRDNAGLIEAARYAMHMGFDGKQAIHPKQIDPIAEVFTPNDETIEHAQRLIEAYQHHQQEGKGAFAYEGKMVDTPILRAAENVLAKARAAGKISY